MSDASPVRRPATLLLVLVASLSPLTMHVYLPSLPGLAADLSASDAQVQLTLSVYLFAAANAQLMIGPLSDRYGRRPVLIGGLVLFLLATLACRFAPSIEALIAARGVQAIGGSVGMVLARAMVRDVSTRTTAASLLGYVTMGMAMAQMLGPAVGGLLDGLYGWQAAFDLLLALGVLVLVLSLTTLPETNRTRLAALSPAALWQSHGALLTEGRFWAHALTAAGASATFFAFLGGGPLIAQRGFDLSPVAYGLHFAFLAAGYAAGNFLSGRFAERIGPAGMILSGNLLSLGAMLTLAALLAAGVWHPLSLFLPMLASSLANGLCIPSSFSGALSVRPDLAGTASGLTGWIQVSLGAAATVVVGWFIHLGPWPLVLIMLALSAFALVAGQLSTVLDRRAGLEPEAPITPPLHPR